MIYFDLLEIPLEIQGILSSASVIGEMNFVKTKKESQLVSDPVAFRNIHFSTCYELYWKTWNYTSVQHAV